MVIIQTTSLIYDRSAGKLAVAAQALDSRAFNGQLLCQTASSQASTMCSASGSSGRFLKKPVSGLGDENFSAASVHLVEQSDLRNAIMDLVVWRVRRRRRIWQ